MIKIQKMVFLLSIIAVPAAHAQDRDEAYVDSLRTLQAVGRIGAITKDWCDERSPGTRATHAAGLKAWRAATRLDEVDALLEARTPGRSVDMSDKRARYFASLDSQYPKPQALCGDLQRSLGRDLDPRKLYPEEYKSAMSRPPQTAPVAPRVATDTAQGATAPTGQVTSGRALGQADIAAVVYAVEEHYVGMNYVADESTYLLLKDGSARDGLPREAPADFDLAADRRQNPKRWGRWRKSNGQYLFQFGNGAFSAPRRQAERLPGEKGQRIDKYFGKSSGESHGTVGLWQSQGLRLNSNGTFKRSSSSGGGGTAGSGDTAASVHSATTDKRSQTVTSSPAGGVSTSRRTGVTDADLTGSYEIDGYTLTLKYNNGWVERSFFYISDHGKAIWFEGKQLMNFD